jgi:tRNA-binding EMAP/Myf-like protein
MGASIDDLERLDVRAGTVARCEPFPEAWTPAYKLTLRLYADRGVVVLVGPDRSVPDGARLG